MAQGFQRIAIPLHNKTGESCGWWILEAASKNCDLSVSNCVGHAGTLPTGWMGLPCDGHAPIRIVYRGDMHCIQLDETTGYEWTTDHPEQGLKFRINSSLEGRNWSTRQHRSGSFKVVNHLGMADFKLESDLTRPLALSLEIVSRKLDFETEYRRMTEDISDFCQQLLLNWQAPTALDFSFDGEEESKLLLEQFIFLRNFMSDERLRPLMEAIERNPHSTLIRERLWVPSSAARSSDFVSRPESMLRNWKRDQSRLVAMEAMDVRKEDSHDTPPNRFIKHALGSFRAICGNVVEISTDADGRPRTAGIEALEMIRELDAVLARPFFRDVGIMRRLPLDNQTLQKREGYREILRAWLLTRAAASLRWEGEREAYRGSTRDVATLYEYWIFIRLHELIGSISGMRDLAPTESTDSFISEGKGYVTINLKAGRHSLKSFAWKGPTGAELRIDLHYERTFSYNSSAVSGGSYTRQFRPDYTLSLYPAEYPCENEAATAGRVAHLHFDAKYRAETVKGLFGDLETDEEEISEEKREAKSEQVYKRGDLLKMHTYNDALRHTVGSYVLYPGTAGQGAEKLGKFHEISPGVGAIVMKPSADECLDTLRDFIMEVMVHQLDGFSQYRYLTDVGHNTHGNSPRFLEDEEASYRIARTKAPCVVLWMRPGNAQVFREHGIAYCHALDPAKKDRLNINLSIETGSEFIPCGGKSGHRKGLGWRAKIKSARLMAISELQAYISKRGLSGELKPSSSTHYILYEFDEESVFPSLDLECIYSCMKTGSQYMAVTCTWDEILDSLPQEMSDSDSTDQ